MRDARAALDQLQRTLRTATQRAAEGDFAWLRRNAAKISTPAGRIADFATSFECRVTTDVPEFIASEAYVEELLDEAAHAGLFLTWDGHRFVCPPDVVSILPKELAVQAGQARVYTLRADGLVANLLARQRDERGSLPLKVFLRILLTGYEFVVVRQRVRTDAVVRLLDVWAALTMLPGQRRMYTRHDFARDLCRLDDGTATEVDGRRLRWAASTGTRNSGLLRAVAPDGEERTYWGISFSDEEKAKE